MNFRGFLDEIQKINCDEIRGRTESSLEVVVDKKNLDKIIHALEIYFGAALKPQGQRPSAESDRYSNPYGGVRQDQTLYFRKDEKGFAIAMLWPWGNGASVTVKIFRGHIEEPAQKGKKSFFEGLFRR